jgi:serine/threonine protein kinase
MVKTARSDAAPESDVKAGAVFAGRYRIVRPLGEGRRKRTYLAEDTLLGRKVALALIKETAEGAPELCRNGEP